MSLYIKIENNLPVNHPADEENIRLAFPWVDLSSISEFAPFIRLPVPSPVDMPVNKFQVLDVFYILAEDGISYTDSYFVRDMIEEEKQLRIQQEIYNVTNLRELYLTTVDKELLESPNEQILVDFKNSLVSITQEAIETNPFSVTIQQFPRKDVNTGIWTSLQTTGTAPNVIG